MFTAFWTRETNTPLIVMLDLGAGILDDATVEAAGIILEGGPS
jgi:hypothetical protein